MEENMGFVTRADDIVQANGTLATALGKKQTISGRSINITLLYIIKLTEEKMWFIAPAYDVVQLNGTLTAALGDKQTIYGR